MEFRKDPAKNAKFSNRSSAASPVHQVPVLQRQVGNMFDQVREEFDRPISNSFLTPSPNLNLSKKHSPPLQRFMPSRSTPTALNLKNLTKQNRRRYDRNYKSHHSRITSRSCRPSRALLAKSVSKMALWDFRQRLKSESSFDGSEKTNSVSEDSSPTFCISLDETLNLSDDDSMNEEFDNFTF